MGRSGQRQDLADGYFFDSLPGERKLRIHFHRFMHRVHDELKGLTGQADPLKLIASKLAGETDVICFDEFFVSDITDAMLLGTLFQELFGHGVVLVATSNIPPQDLYRNGLQRAVFYRRSRSSSAIARYLTWTAAPTIACVRWSRRRFIISRWISRQNPIWIAIFGS